jgi:hypothetical protein
MIEELRENRQHMIVTIDEKYVLRILRKYIKNLPYDSILDSLHYDFQMGCLCARILNEEFESVPIGKMSPIFHAEYDADLFDEGQKK